MTAQSPENEATNFLARLPRGQREVVEALRQTIRRVVPETAETVLWGSLSYHRPSIGGRIKGAVCLITPKEDCVHLGFIHGAALADPLRLLRGSGKAKRFLPVQGVADAERQAVRDLLKAASEYDPRAAA
jgi:hypothetical protein